MKTIFSILLLMGYYITSAQQSGKVIGKLIDSTSNTIPFGLIQLYQNQIIVSQSQTDFDGNFSISPVFPGIYNILARSSDYKTHQLLTNIPVKPGRLTRTKLQLTSKNDTTIYVEVIIIEDSDIKKLPPTRNISDIVSLVGGVSTICSPPYDSLNPPKGDRNDSHYYIFGLKMIGGESLPKSAIIKEEFIYGLPAEHNGFDKK